MFFALIGPEFILLGPQCLDFVSAFYEIENGREYIYLESMNRRGVFFQEKFRLRSNFFFPYLNWIFFSDG